MIMIGKYQEMNHNWHNNDSYFDMNPYNMEHKRTANT